MEVLATASFLRKPLRAKGEVLGKGSHNVVLAMKRRDCVLRLGMKAPKSLDDAEASVREAVFTVIMGEARIGPSILHYGWSSDGRAWSVQERGAATLDDWLMWLWREEQDLQRQAKIAAPSFLERWDKSVAKSMILGLRRVASNGFFAGDVKPGNMLVMDDDTVRIIDFDLAYAVWAPRDPGDSCEHVYLLTLALLCFHVYERLDRLAKMCNGPFATKVTMPLRQELLAAGRQRICFSLDCKQQDVGLAYLPLDSDEEGQRFHERLRHYFERKEQKGVQTCNRGRRKALLADVLKAERDGSTEPVECNGRLRRTKEALERALAEVRKRYNRKRKSAWDPTAWKNCLQRACLAARTSRSRRRESEHPRDSERPGESGRSGDSGSSDRSSGPGRTRDSGVLGEARTRTSSSLPRTSPPSLRSARRAPSLLASYLKTS